MDKPKATAKNGSISHDKVTVYDGTLTEHMLAEFFCKKNNMIRIIQVGEIPDISKFLSTASEEFSLLCLSDDPASVNQINSFENCAARLIKNHQAEIPFILCGNSTILVLKDKKNIYVALHVKNTLFAVAYLNYFNRLWENRNTT